MSDIKCDPYLYFKGTCREAMEFYKSVFGGELTVQTYADVGMADSEMGADKLMHAMLEGGAVKLMASDTPNASDKAMKVSISVGGTDEATLTEIFNKLSDGAEVTHPLKKEFWGDMFGGLIDKHGIDWMVNITEVKE